MASTDPNPDPFAPYAAAHVSPSGPGDARPTALQVLADNDLLYNNAWAGKVVLVTGGTSGIGVETVRALHATGADVFFTARNEKKLEELKEDVLRAGDGEGKGKAVVKGKLEGIMMDLESLESVRAAAARFLELSPGRLNVLVNNAGIMSCPQSKTVDGFDRQFAVNHLGHFVLTVSLLPALLASSTPTFASRVINVSSSAHQASSIHFDDPNLTNNYAPRTAYGQSKTATIWTANYIDRVYGPRGVHALALHPGGIWTNLQQYWDKDVLEGLQNDPNVRKWNKSVEQGAATTVWAACGKIWEGKGGKYLADVRVAPPAKSFETGQDRGVGEDAYNREGEDRLWELSCRWTGVTAP